MQTSHSCAVLLGGVAGSTALDCLHGKCVRWRMCVVHQRRPDRPRGARTSNVVLLGPCLSQARRPACTVRAWCCAIAAPRPTSVHRSVCAYRRGDRQWLSRSSNGIPRSASRARAQSENAWSMHNVGNDCIRNILLGPLASAGALDTRSVLRRGAGVDACVSSVVFVSGMAQRPSPQLEATRPPSFPPLLEKPRLSGSLRCLLSNQNQK
jgi:hypothetical protein